MQDKTKNDDIKAIFHSIEHFNIRLACQRQNREWSLQECIDYGVEKSLSMQQRELQNKNDKLDVRDATLSLLPSVSGISPGVNYSFGRGIDPETNTYTNTRYMSVGGFGVGSSLTVFAGFSNINRLRAAKLSRLMGWEETENQANQIAIQVMNAFFTLLYAEEEVRITQEQVENSRLRLKKIEREYELGKKPKSDLFEMQAQQASVEFRLITAQNNCLNAQANLKYIMNYNAEEELKIDARSVSEVHPELHELKTKEVFTQALQTLPEIKLAAYQIRSAQLGVYSARAGLYPSISISGSISFGNYSDQRSGDFFSQITDRNQIGKGFSIGMSIPFYSGLSRRSSLQRAKHNYQSSKIQYQQTERALYNEIQQALQDLKSCTPALPDCRAAREFQHSLLQRRPQTLRARTNHHHRPEHDFQQPPRSKVRRAASPLGLRDAEKDD